MEAWLAMKAVDPHGEMEINTDSDRVTVRMPLTSL